MKLPTENKGFAPTAGKCPRCGRKGAACREVPAGFWCQQYGLEEDRTRWIIPTRDPVSEAVRTDPAVLATRLERDNAQAAFDKATQAWEEALARLATARIRAANGAIIAGPAGEPMEYQPPSRRDRKRHERLIEEEVEARTERERLGEELVKARVRHHKATVVARLVATADGQ